MEIIKTESIKLDNDENFAWNTMNVMLTKLAHNSDIVNIRNLADTALDILSDLADYLME